MHELLGDGLRSAVMTTKLLLIAGVPLLISGCVYSHRTPEVVYTPVPAPHVVVPAPTSSRPGERVYVEPIPPPPTAAPTSPGATVSAADLAIAEHVRDLIPAGSPAVPAAIQARVKSGVVTLSGLAPTDNDRDLLVRRVKAIPGVARVVDELKVTLR